MKLYLKNIVSTIESRQSSKRKPNFLSVKTHKRPQVNDSKTKIE